MIKEVKQKPAFPTRVINSDEGMALRDYFAAKALQGMLSDHTVGGDPATICAYAFKYADAMLDARGDKK